MKFFLIETLICLVIAIILTPLVLLMEAYPKVSFVLIVSFMGIMSLISTIMLIRNYFESKFHRLERQIEDLKVSR